MKLADEIRIAAPRDRVWAALNDIEVLKASIPGCEELTKDSDTQLSAVVQAKIGPVKAKFKGSVTLSDLNPPESYRISGEGKGGAAGFAKGSAAVTLTDDGEATLLTYTVEAKVGGKLAQLGGRLIDGFARKLTDEFFNRFQLAVEGPAESETDSDGEGDSGDDTKKGWLKRLIS
ncbi:MAG: carbon monoxide dehydrogenase subunit G [Proteobacteria bacterium]|nr:carbon monoxide dehydrogenase subunit G [Pseudomonadota bacterium]